MRAVEEQIDQAAAKLWGLTDAELGDSLADLQWKPGADEGAEDDEASGDESEEGVEAVAD